MADLHGADIEAMAELDRTIRAHVNRVNGLNNSVSGAVSASAAFWRGNDANEFRQEWTSRHRRNIVKASAALTEMAETITRNREAQVVTSSTDAAAGLQSFDSPGWPFVADGGGSKKPEESKPTLDEIVDSYQVVEDEIITWRPNLGPLPFGLPFDWGPSEELTRTEGELLDDLANREGLNGLRVFRNTRGDAIDAIDEYFPPDKRDTWGGHADAFRHMYWNAIMVRRFGPEFAEDFATAHEGVAGNPAADEAMDLYNNSLGRQIALDNPDASDKELADLIYEAVESGDAVVLDGEGNLAFSDEVEQGQTGDPTGPAADGEGTMTPGDGPGEY
jgi:hypothetical protein